MGKFKIHFTHVRVPSIGEYSAKYLYWGWGGKNKKFALFGETFSPKSANFDIFYPIFFKISLTLKPRRFTWKINPIKATCVNHQVGVAIPLTAEDSIWEDY